MLPVLENCENCGACCQTVSAPPFRIDAERNELEERGVPEDLAKELMPVWEVRLYISESPCLWFDERTQGCGHYELRPQACRDFELNSPSCLAIREMYGVDVGQNPST